MSKFNVISSDSHVVEWPHLWQERIDKRFKDRAPRLVREKDKDVFLCEGFPPSGAAMWGPAGRKSEDLSKLNRFEDNRKGGYDPDERLKDMAADGVDAEVLYPTIGFRLFRMTDPEYQFACMKAYNDWLAEMVGVHPDRIKGLALIPISDMELAVNEMHRTKKLGLAGAMIPIYPEETKPYSDPRYDPMWRAAQELDMPVSLHILTAVGRPPFEQFTIDYASQNTWAERSLAAMIFGGVFERYPRMKVVSAEADIGWVANFLRRIDHAMTRHGPRLGLKLNKMPTEYFHNNVYATFMNDEAGLRTWDLIGVNNIMWSSDYPHTDSTWPDSQKVIADTFKGVPAEAKKQILCDNAAKLYHFA